MLSSCNIEIIEDEEGLSIVRTIGRNTYQSMINTDLKEQLDYMLQNSIINSKHLNFDMDERLKLAFDPDYKNEKLKPSSFLAGFANYGIKKMLENGTLEIIPLGHLRGRSLRNSIVFCTECENLTRQHLQLLMGRIDEGSQLWIDGDTKQRDRAIFEQSAGLERMVDRLAGNKLFAHIHLEKSERSEVAALADMLDD